MNKTENIDDLLIEVVDQYKCITFALDDLDTFMTKVLPNISEGLNLEYSYRSGNLESMLDDFNLKLEQLLSSNGKI